MELLLHRIGNKRPKLGPKYPESPEALGAHRMTTFFSLPVVGQKPALSTCLITVDYSISECSAVGIVLTLGAQALPQKILYRGVAQLVARLLWEQEARGSSPRTPTMIN